MLSRNTILRGILISIIISFFFVILIVVTNQVTNSECLIKFLSFFTIGIPVFLQFFLKVPKPSLSMNYLEYIVGLFLLPFIWVFLYQHGGQQFNIEIFIKNNSSFVALTKTICFVLLLYIDEIIKFAYVRSAFSSRIVQNSKDAIVLFFGLHYGVDFFAFGIFALSFKESFFYVANYFCRVNIFL